MSYDLRIVQLRYTKAQFEATNPTVLDGQLCVETDSGVYTVGAGTYMSIRGNATLSAQERVSADDVWNAMNLNDGRDESGGATDPTPFIYVTAGDGATGIYEYQFENEGKDCYVLLGATASAASLLNCVVWSDGGGGAKWNITDATGEVLFTSDDDVATPDLATTWELDQGTGMLPSIEGYPGPTLDEMLQQIAEKQTRPALRTGSTIAFDGDAIYNSVTAPSSGSVTLDLSGATPCSVVAYFNHASEPSWPSGVEAVGAWNNSALNIVEFIYQDSSNISASINSDAAVSTTNGGWPRIDKAVTEPRTSSTTLTADTDLQFSMVANGKYQVRCKLWGGVSGTGPGWKYGFTGPASPTLVRASGHHLSSVATPPTNYTQNAYETTGKVFPSSAAGLHSVDLDLYIENGANAGNFQITWAQNASSGTAASMGRGSFVEYVRVA